MRNARDNWALARYFLRLGTTGFGGPIALVGYMQRDLVERRRWLTPGEYTDGLAFSQLAPGPLAAQLAIYIGWVRGGPRGATVAGLAFVLPSFAIVVALSALYVRFGGLTWMQAAFHGVGAAAIAVMARSVAKLVRISLKRDALLWSVCAVNAVVVLAAQAELIWVFVASGLLVLAVRARAWPRAGVAAAFAPWPLALAPVASAAPAVSASAWQVLWFFAKAGAVVFGSGLAIVPFLYGGAVAQYHWLTERQFIDAIAVSMITPGPVVITVAFIGYLVAGMSGAAMAALGVFLPVYLAVVVAAPYFQRFKEDPRVAAFVAGVTAAATGALAGAAVILARRALPDWRAVAVASAAFALLAWRKVPEAVVMVAAGLIEVVAGTA